MKKLSLKLDDLQVASFDTGETGEDRGTVHGHDHSRPPHDTCRNTCDCITNYNTCLEPCGTTLCGSEVDTDCCFVI